MEEIEPCPFCGSDNVDIGRRYKSTLSYIFCRDCDAQGPTSDMERIAIDFWNNLFWKEQYVKERDALLHLLDQLKKEV